MEAVASAPNFGGGDESEALAGTAEAGWDTPLLFTPQEAARMLHISRAHLYDYILSGQLQSVKLGRCRRIPAAALQRFVDALAKEATGTSGGDGHGS
jgi:excisionase family DNA binding protein